MRLRFAVALLVSLIVAWVVSGYMWVGVSYLNPIYLHIHATSQAPRAFALSYASDEQFSDSSHTLIDILLQTRHPYLSTKQELIILCVALFLDD